MRNNELKIKNVKSKKWNLQVNKKTKKIKGNDFLRINDRPADLRSVSLQEEK